MHVPGSGVYTLTLATPPASINNLVVEATQIGSVAGMEAVIVGVPDQVIVHTFDAAGVFTDRFFMVTVHDVT